MKRREFLVGLGAAAAVASASQVLAQGAPASGMEGMHAPKYKALEESTAHCVGTGDDCLRHCFGMMSMGDASMVGCTKAAYDMVAGCTGCQKECEKYPNIPECKACGESCANCAQECSKVAA